MSLPHPNIGKVEQPKNLPDVPSEPASNPYGLNGLFSAAATLLLAVNAPIQFAFRPHVVETVGVTMLGIALVTTGVLRLSSRLFGAGSLLLLAVISLCMWTQPAELERSIRTVWPLRLAVPLILSLVWVLLLNPVPWLRRTLLAIAVPSGLLLVAISQTATIPLAPGAKGDTTANFTPYWLAIDQHGTLYASSATGNAILVFDATGRPQGTIWPAQIPAAGTRGSGIIPAGGGAIIASLNALTLPTPTLNPGFHDPDADTSLFWFYGLAVDTQDRLYLVDRHVPGNASVLQFNRAGNLTARWPLPRSFTAALGCLTTDRNHVYLSTSSGQVFVFDYNGTLLKTLKLPYQPSGIVAASENQLLILGQQILNRIDINTGATITMTLPPPSGELVTPYQALAVTQAGTVLVTDQGRNQVLMIDARDGQVVQAIGRPGPWPGQFGSLGGLAQDQAGRIYIADPQHRVIQRFTGAGRLDAIWSAHESGTLPAKR